jgi:hypothetical protein
MTDTNNSLNRDNLLNEINTTWSELQTLLASLSEEQFTALTDAAGWTAKDHVIHLAMWEKAALALLEGKSKRECLNISPEVWEQDDDPINAVLQERYHDMALNEVMQTLNQNHEQIVNKIASMSQEDLLLPYSHYKPDSTGDFPIIRAIHWDTVHHYGEHQTWIAAIVEED